MDTSKNHFDKISLTNLTDLANSRILQKSPFGDHIGQTNFHSGIILFIGPTSYTELYRRISPLKYHHERCSAYVKFLTEKSDVLVGYKNVNFQGYGIFSWNLFGTFVVTKNQWNFFERTFPHSFLYVVIFTTRKFLLLFQVQPKIVLFGDLRVGRTCCCGLMIIFKSSFL